MKINGQEISYYNDEYLEKYLTTATVSVNLGKIATILCSAGGIIAGLFPLIEYGLKSGFEQALPFWVFGVGLSIFFGLLWYYATRQVKEIEKVLNERSEAKGIKPDVSEKEERKKNSAIITGIIIALLVIFAIILLFKISSSSSNGDGVNTCKNCGRSPVVAGFGYCGDCYDGFTDWQDDNWE